MTFWSLTNSDFPTNQTFQQFRDLDTDLDLHRLWVVSMEHLQRHASRERSPFRTPGSVPIVGLACAPIVETRFLELAMSLLDFSPRIPFGIFSVLLVWVSLSCEERAASDNSKWKFMDPVQFELATSRIARWRLRPLGQADWWGDVFKSHKESCRIK